MRTLKKGDHGADVKILQQDLVQLGHLRGNVDGHFGQVTHKAVCLFQQSKNLEVDGVVGDKTWKLLGHAIENETIWHDLGLDLMARSNEGPMLWYPNRAKGHCVENLQMKVQGNYTYGHPQGAVIHYSGGRSRSAQDEGPRCEESDQQQGIKQVQFAIKQNIYCYFIIDREGRVYQNFPLSHWGHHAGSSYWPSLGHGVSSSMVGIELMSAGRLQDFWGPMDHEGHYTEKHQCPPDQYAAWYTNLDKGDKFFGPDKETRYSEGCDNIKPGVYHAFSIAQENALLDLLLWLENNGQGIFQFENVVGHDEVAKDRKSDPGACLSMSMPQFREYLKEKKKSKNGQETLFDDTHVKKAA